MDRIFEYSCTDEVKPGCRVKVPFGRRIMDGFVSKIKDTCDIDPAKVKAIASVFDEVPALVPECLWLSGRVSLRYDVPRAAALRLLLPSEMRKGRVRELYRKYVTLAPMPVSSVSATGCVADNAGGINEAQTIVCAKTEADEDFAGTVGGAGNTLDAAGETSNNTGAAGAAGNEAGSGALNAGAAGTAACGALNAAALNAAAMIAVNIPKNAAKQREAAEYLAAHGEAEYTPLCEMFGRSAITGLEKRGAIRIEKRRVQRKPVKDVVGIDNIHVLTPAQRMAIKSISTTDKMVSLLHGVTGSGKTEIYLQIIGQEIEKGRNAIFLVPEISLTPQMLAQLRARFKGQAAILHSGLSAGERFDEWWRLRSGEAKIAIGARSAIFAPLENIGVIIIDEEHDSSYVSETAPRYSTIDIAMLRAKYNKAKLILGSATPSVETYIEAKEGRFNLITLTERINRKPMPDIIVTDMRKEVKRGNSSSFSTELREQLQQTLESGNQAIIFLNRRGYSQTVLCRDCGYVAKCEDCDVSLTYHSEEGCLICHYCGRRYRMPAECPVCKGRHIKYNGTGTQKVVADLKELFPQARLLRMDNDTVSGKDGHYRILQQFAKHEADILVGTQMIAKGHDFPSVTLVGILDADMSLQFSDYRSGERTFQLITQVAGRSGRAGAKGTVVLQTYNPENYILRYAVNYDYQGFFENEVRIRKATWFPPFSLIVRIMVTSEQDDLALAALKTVCMQMEDLKKANPKEFIFMNKMHSPIKRIEKKFRYQVLMRLTGKSLLPRIYDICASASTPQVLTYVEENPANLS